MRPTTLSSLACVLTTTLTAGACLEREAEDELGVEVEEIAHGTVVPVGELEAVGFLQSFGLCTGTLISDSVVLTSAHCLCDHNDVTSCATSGTFTFMMVRPVDNPLTPINESLTRQNITLSGEPIVHPDFGIGAHLANDIGVLRLAQPASSKALVQPMQLDFTLPAAGSVVTMVGLGGTNNAGSECDGSLGTKRKGTTQLDQVIMYAAPSDISLKLSTAAGLAHGCGGDSGGPALNTQGRVIGTHSTAGGDDKAVFAYLEWLAMQAGSKGNRLGAWDLSASAPVAASDYADTTPDPYGLLGWIDANDVRLPGDYFGRGADQVLYINRGGSGGKLRIAAYEDGTSRTESFYWEDYGYSTLFNGWIDANDAHLVGDFLDRGHDQLLLVNRSGSGGRVMVVDFYGGIPQIGYLASYTTDPFLNGWHDTNDGLLAGDFRGLGYDQVMFVNRGVGNGRVLITDLHDGVAPADWVYYEAYSQGVFLNGWHDAGDLLLAGDFRGLGRDQVMFINRGAGNGRVLITDFGDGWFPAEWMYYEAYGQSTVLDTFHDSTSDVALAGDFRGAGHDQVAFVNRNAPWFYRVQVTDFADGAVPATISFLQNQAMTSPLLQRIDANDIVLAADVRGRGHMQLFTIEGLEQ